MCIPPFCYPFWALYGVAKPSLSWRAPASCCTSQGPKKLWYSEISHALHLLVKHAESVVDQGICMHMLGSETCSYFFFLACLLCFSSCKKADLGLGSPGGPAACQWFQSMKMNTVLQNPRPPTFKKPLRQSSWCRWRWRPWRARGGCGWTSLGSIPWGSITWSGFLSPSVPFISILFLPEFAPCDSQCLVLS